MCKVTLSKEKEQTKYRFEKRILTKIAAVKCFKVYLNYGIFY